MEIQKFIQNFAEQFDETDVNVFTKETEFRNLDEWSSLIALSIMAMTEERYGVILNGQEMRSAVTIGDLFNIVCCKKNA